MSGLADQFALRLNRGSGKDDCRKASHVQRGLSNGGPMVENAAFHASGEIAKNKWISLTRLYAYAHHGMIE